MLERAPWDRQERESQQAFAAFQYYLQTPPHERSLRKCVVKWAREHGVEFSDEDLEGDWRGAIKTKLNQWARWSSKYRWVERVAAWDEHVERMRRLELMKEAAEAARRHAAIARAIQRPALERVQSLNPASLSPSDALRYLAEGIRLEREALRMGQQDEEMSDAVEVVVRIKRAEREKSVDPAGGVVGDDGQ